MNGHLRGLLTHARVFLKQTTRLSALRAVWFNLMVGVGALPTILVASPAIAAEYIRVQYGPVELSISVKSLETFAREGRIEDDLATYARQLKDEQLDEIGRLLVSSADIDHVALANFLYTRQGEILLQRLGSVIRTESNSGFYALRAALILAAREEEGLTPLNVLEYFPTNSIVVDVERALGIVQELDRLISTTSDAIALIETQYQTAVSEDPPANLNPTVELNDLGPYRWQEQTLTLDDPRRNRTFQVDLYLPNVDTPAPVIVISHGLGSDRTTYAYLARHLASYGFAIAAPEHPGSNAEYIQALFTGTASQVADPSEFVDRALDVKFILDELERRAEAESELQRRLDLQQVGVIGQSFGGYTALALAGATINFNQLQEDCPQGDVQEDTLNLSLLLQCRALELAPPIVELKDDRIQAIMAINPIGSTVFGKEGFENIEIPVFVVSGSADIVAPTLIEQILPFSWLQTTNKYLLLIRKSTHFSTIGTSEEGSETVLLPPEIVGPQPELAQTYVKAMSVAFMRRYITKQGQYREYLSPEYVNVLSQDPLPLTLVRSLNSDELLQVIKQNRLVLSSVRPADRERRTARR